MYLPKKWTEKKNLKEGNVVYLSEIEGDLLIKSNIIKEKKTISITLDNNNEKNLKNLLTYSYRRGFDEIKISNLTKKSLDEIKNIVREFMLGFEITKKTQSECIVENISEPTDQKYEVLLRKMLLSIQEMLEILETDSKSNKFIRTEEIIEIRNQQDKFALFCRRILMKGIYEKNPILSWEFLTFITHLSHLINYAYEYCSKNKLKLSKQSLYLIPELKKQFISLTDSYYQKDFNALNKLTTMREDYMFGKCIHLLENTKGKENVFASYLRELFRQIQIGTSPILNELIEESQDKSTSS